MIITHWHIIIHPTGILYPSNFLLHIDCTPQIYERDHCYFPPYWPYRNVDPGQVTSKRLRKH